MSDNELKRPDLGDYAHLDQCACGELIDAYEKFADEAQAVIDRLTGNVDTLADNIDVHNNIISVNVLRKRITELEAENNALTQALGEHASSLKQAERLLQSFSKRVAHIGFAHHKYEAAWPADNDPLEAYLQEKH